MGNANVLFYLSGLHRGPASPWDIAELLKLCTWGLEKSGDVHLLKGGYRHLMRNPGALSMQLARCKSQSRDSSILASTERYYRQRVVDLEAFFGMTTL